jgi:hypothetical protein
VGSVVPPEALLVLNFARVISDFWSACLFANHLCVVYARLEKGVPAEAIQIVAPRLTYQHLAAQERLSFMQNPEIPFRLMQVGLCTYLRFRFFFYLVAGNDQFRSSSC